MSTKAEAALEAAGIETNRGIAHGDLVSLSLHAVPVRDGREWGYILKAHSFSMERKKPIKKNHIKEFGGRMPRRRPRDKLGTSQGHMGHLGLIYV